MCVKIPVLACLLLEHQGYCCLVGHPLTAAAATAKNKTKKKQETPGGEGGALPAGCPVAVRSCGATLALHSSFATWQLSGLG